MKFKKILAAALAACTLLLCGCENLVDHLIPDTTGDDSAFVPVDIEEGYVYFKDFDGNEIMLDGAPSSVASLSPVATEIIVGIGAGRFISVIDSESAKIEGAPISAETVPYYYGDFETMKRKAPEIVFYSSGTIDLVQMSQLQKEGMKLVRIPERGNIATAEANIRFIASLLFRDAAGERIISEMRGQMDRMKIAAELAGVRKTVYIENLAQFSACGSNSIVSELCAIAGADNIFTDIGAGRSVSAALISERDPELVIILTMSPDTFDKNSFRKREGVDQVYASRTKSIYALDYTTATRPTQNIVKALTEIGRIMKIVK